MRATYDTDVDAAYVSLKEIAAGEARHQVVVQADALASGSEIILDLDADGRPIGIEVLGARNGLPSELLKVAKQL
jgi:uncharacterized protein YuzE